MPIGLESVAGHECGSQAEIRRAECFAKSYGPLECVDVPVMLGGVSRIKEGVILLLVSLACSWFVFGPLLT